MLRCVLIAGFVAIWAGNALAQTSSQPTWPDPSQSILPTPNAFYFDAPELTPLSVSTGFSTGTALTRDPEIGRLADALDNDVDRIYEYVRNHIQTTPTFGLTKGAYGTMLDEAGNPFDQIHLFVELVREAGHTANYVYGDVTIPASDFESFFGPSTRRGACELLAAGGIPSEIDGIVTSDCSSASYDGALTTSVEMRHIWAQVTIGGNDYHFDPSLKPHNFVNRNASLLASAPSASAINTALTPDYAPAGVTGTSHVTAYSGGELDNLRNTYATSAANLRNAIETAEASSETAYAGTAHAMTVPTHEPLDLENIVGGLASIEPQIISHPSLGSRQSSHPFSSEQDTHAEIDDSLVTWVHIRISIPAAQEDPQPTTINGPMYLSYPAPELAGRRLMIAGDSMGILPDTRTATWLQVMRDEEVLQRRNVSGTVLGPSVMTMASCTTPAGSSTPCTTQHLEAQIDISVRHPFSGGTDTAQDFASDVYSFSAPTFTPSFIILGLGERGNGAETRNVAAIGGSGRSTYSSYYPTSVQGGGDEPVPVFSELTTDSLVAANGMMAAAEGFLTNASRMTDIFEGLAEGRAVEHHRVGLSSYDLTFSTNGYQTEIGRPEREPVSSGSQAFLDVVGQAGFAQRHAGSRQRSSFGLALGSALAALEQTELRVATDATAVNGTAAMFEWFARAGVGEAFGPHTSSASIRYIEMTAANLSNSAGLLRAGNPNIGNTYTAYTGDDFTVVSPQSRSLGPVRDNYRTNINGDRTFIPTGPTGSGFGTTVSCSPCQIEDFDTDDAYLTRYPAYVAYRTEANGSVAVAPMAQGRHKGGGAANFAEGLEPPSIDREGLDEAYESWATSYSVDMRTGGLTLSPPADLTTGAGGHPYSLSFQRTYSSDNSALGAMGEGWTHNFDVRLTTGSDIGASLGDQTPRQALAFILVAESLMNLFEDTSATPETNHTTDIVTAQFLLNWWSDMTYDNQVNITRGAGGERFILQPDGVWEPEPGSHAALTHTGSVTREANQTNWPTYTPYPEGSSGVLDPEYRTVSEAWVRNGLVFNYVSADGVQEEFTFGYDMTRRGTYPDQTSPQYPQVTAQIGSNSGRTYLRRHTQYPTGMRLDYEYSNGALSQVRNNSDFGRELNFSYSGGAGGCSIDETSQATPPPCISFPYDAPASILTEVCDENNRCVDFNYTAFPGLFSPPQMRLDLARNVLDQVTLYEYAQPAGSEFVLPTGQLYTPMGMMSDTYRLTEIYLPHDLASPFVTFAYDEDGRIASATNAESQTTEYHIGAGARALTRDPINWETFEYYDRDGRNFITTDQAYIMNYTEYDALGRPTMQGQSYNLYDPDIHYTNTRSFYDEYGNTVLSRQLTQTDASGNHIPDYSFVGSGYIDAVTEYGYSATIGGHSVFHSLPTRGYDGAGNSSETCYHTSQGGNCTGFSASHDGLPRLTLGPSGERTEITYTTLGRVNAEVSLVEGTRTRTVTRSYYAADGLPQNVSVSSTGFTPNGTLTTTFTWDNAGNLVTVTDPSGRRARGTYRADRRLVQLTGSDHDAATASVSRFRYDASGRIEAADVARTINGTVGAFTGSDWNTTWIDYSASGRVSAITDPDGDVRSFLYYNNGLLNSDYDGTTHGGTARRSVFTYYGNGQPFCTVAGYGTADEREPRATWRIETGEIAIWFGGNSIFDPTNPTTNIGDENCQTDAANPNTRQLFDEYRRPYRIEFPMPDGLGGWNYSSSMEWDFDAAGNRAFFINRAGQTFNYEYDASNRNTRTVYPEGDMNFTYNAAGERLRAEWDEGNDDPGDGITNTESATDYEYDFAGRLIRETQSRPEYNQHLNVGYEYDSAGNRTAIIWPDGWVARYAYDGAGRLTSVCEDADANGTCELTLAVYSYDTLGRRTRVDFFGGVGTGTSSIDYTFEADGDLVRLDHDLSIVGTATTVTFAHDYDEAGRLTATGVNRTGMNGNSFLWSAFGTPWTRNYDVEPINDRVEGWTGYDAVGQINYDANGNLSEIVTRRSMFHDSMNRMTAIAGVTTGTGPWDGWLQASDYPDVHSSAFLYDPDGRQIVRTSTRETNLRYAYAGDMVIADIDDQGGTGTTGRVLRRYVPGVSVDERVVMITTNTATCTSLNGAATYGGTACASLVYEAYHADRQGNVIAMVNSSGAMAAQYVYTPYGVEEPYNASTNPYRYTGRRLEAEWGIFNYRARYYDPALGRFYQTDPVLYEDQFNLYAYVGNDPLNMTDPSGMCSYDDEKRPVSGLCAEPGNSDASDLVEMQMNDPNSIASDLDSAAEQANRLVIVTVGTDGGISSFNPDNEWEASNREGSSGGVLNVNPNDQYRSFGWSDQSRSELASGAPVETSFEGGMPLPEIFEHEASHALDSINGVLRDPRRAPEEILLYGQFGTGEVPGGRSGPTEARAVNRTNIYRSRSGIGRQRMRMRAPSPDWMN